MRQFHSLPDPEALGFSWPAFDKALERLRNVEERRTEAERTAEEIQQRIASEKQADVERLAEAIASGEEDPAPPHLEDLADELKEHRRLSKALEEAEPRAEGELAKVVQVHRDQWAPEVDAALEKAIKEERKAYQRASEIATKAREKRQRIEALSRWVRNTPPTFSVPSDVTVIVAVQGWEQDVGRAERQLAELRAEEGRVGAENERREREAKTERESA